MKVKNILGLLFLLMIMLVNADGNKDLCSQVQPTRDILEDCTNQKAENDGDVCCNVTIQFEYNDYNECSPLKKEKNIIEEKIKEYKNTYKDYKNVKVKINCNSTFINISLILFSLSLLFFI